MSPIPVCNMKIAKTCMFNQHVCKTSERSVLIKCITFPIDSYASSQLPLLPEQDEAEESEIELSITADSWPQGRKEEVPKSRGTSILCGTFLCLFVY